MSARSVVVDGSNIATEGRSMPSLGQLVEAVAEYQKEFPDDEVIVVVDATFGHRIDESERRAFDDAVAHNEIVSPPAGAIGRGDAFLLRIADKVGATVLSNDSFQEFHGEHEWLFNNGRLIGGKPVPGVGWIFTPRTPVRGPKSRMAVSEAKRAKRGSPKIEAARSKKVEKAIAVATDEAVEPESTSARRRRRRRSSGGSAPPAEPVNEPLPFIQFVADHKPGGEVEGEVDTFSSHGAFVRVGEARCYIPLSAMGDPPPRAARDALRKGEVRTFVVQALDPPRRGIELALPGFVRVAGTPTDETVEDEIAAGRGADAEPAQES
ncbi:MAG: S1 RNA-binding domain-containing protein, partial [Actinobacteria bacterium]|nr:S1 RNA-binding domain-containing protein [Actinomycetota bacterium]